MSPNSCRIEAGDAGLGRDPASRASRIVVAGLSGDAGKTLVSLALLLAFRERGVDARAFKKGPDYIDAAWLSWASGRPARNLDTWLAGFEAVRDGFERHATTGGINLIEGNRGVFDGVDAEGTHSTAELAKTLRAPVLLVVDARKATRTLAALVLGCRSLDPDLEIGGVVLNRVAGGRHESVARDAIEAACDVKVVGAIPRIDGDCLPGRHLGLVTPEEHRSIGEVRELALKAAGYLDVEAIQAIAEAAVRQAGRLPQGDEEAGRLSRDEGHVPSRGPDGARDSGGAGFQARPRIACLRDSAFSFYYPDNLEALEEAGASLVAVSSLADAALPASIHGLYIGGGFPETHAWRLAENRSLLDSIRRAAADGLPVYAECGGLMLLARALRYQGQRHEMAGVFPFDVEVCPRPQGHGYARLLVEKPNPFFAVGTTLKGHEFHYSRISGEPMLQDTTACRVDRGTGCGSGRDAIISNNVWAAYVHLHAASVPDWAPGFVRAAVNFRSRREQG
jgi:cobyrinic acid a,c-diamide synthase